MKKEEMTKEQEADMVAKRDANRIIANEGQVAMDEETASHQYQAGSAAVDTNVTMKPGESILNKIDTKENLKAKEDAAKAMSEGLEAIYGYNDDVDCSKRDVSDPLYCQPGSDRHKAFTKKK